MITVDRKNLLLALTRLNRVIVKRHRMPLLTCVAIDADKNGTRVYGTDLDLWCETKIEVTGDLSIRVNHRQMAAVIKACPGQDVTLEAADDDKAKVMSGKYIAVLDQIHATEPVDLFAPTFKKKTHCLLDTKSLGRAIRFVSTDETRYYLNGVHVARNDGQVRVTSTDGHRMFRADGGKSNLKTQIDMIMPSAAVKFINAMAMGKPVKVDIGDNHCRYRGGR